MHDSSRLIIGLDVGTTKICTVVAEEDKDSQGVRVLGFGQVPSRGLRKGCIIDMDQAVAAIIKSVEDAEKMANVEIHSVFAGIAGGHVKSFNSKGIAAIGDNAEIGARDVERAINAARAVSLPADREILHTIPQEFIIDGQGGVREPEGMSGVRLEAEVHIITGAITSAQNIIKSINRAGIEVEDIVLESIASGIAVLSEDEKNSGVLLVDIGGGTTDSLIFHGGSLKHTHVIAVGGDHATNDISVALRIPISAAEDVKKNYGCALEDRVAPNEEFELSSIAGRAVTRYSRRELAHIIELRMRELFSHVRQQLDRTGLGNLLGGGVVLTGGGAVMDGTVELAERIFKLPVRLGKPTGFSGLTEVLESPIYATGTGLTQYGYRFRKEGRVSRFRGRGFFSKVLDRMRSWFRKGGA